MRGVRGVNFKYEEGSFFHNNRSEEGRTVSGSKCVVCLLKRHERNSH